MYVTRPMYGVLIFRVKKEISHLFFKSHLSFAFFLPIKISADSSGKNLVVR